MFLGNVGGFNNLIPPPEYDRWSLSVANVVRRDNNAAEHRLSDYGSKSTDFSLELCILLAVVLTELHWQQLQCSCPRLKLVLEIIPTPSWDEFSKSHHFKCYLTAAHIHQEQITILGWKNNDWILFGAQDCRRKSNIFGSSLGSVFENRF